MKTFLKILFGLALGGAAIVAVVFWATAGLPDAADGFFKKVAAKDFEGALALTTSDFRASTSADALATFAHSNGLDGYASASWSSRSISSMAALSLPARSSRVSQSRYSPTLLR